MDFVEVKLLKYQFRFRRLHWRGEFRVKFPPKIDPVKWLLANALEDVSGLKMNSVAEAMKVLGPLPPAIITRIFKIYKGSEGLAREFKTGPLYKAPEPQKYQRLVEEGEVEEDKAHERTMERARRTFGQQELEETQEIERQILAGARRKDGSYRGESSVTPDGRKDK